MPYAINSGENLLLQFNLIELTSGLTWKGVYDNTTAYVVNDAVLATDSHGYKCILNSTGHAPPNATYWTVLADVPPEDIMDVTVEIVDQSNGKTVVTYVYALSTPQTSGLLVIGQKYMITAFVSGDDFSNLGATNATGNVFVATGDTPTTWTHASTLMKVADPANIVLTTGLLKVEVLKADTKPLDGVYELRTTISFAAAAYMQSGAQTDVLCLPDALTVTPC